ncbi:trypsin-like serine protease [Amycolatopsis sp. BJA-103]|uniref:trypsin-like serine protease n=1 Tax=Amycolatopsis sp. BJA-103 TaxID=1911175 RepID=UPI000C77C3E0|nr:trypsin-like serine protease [Amycolatopsis sp. BJA-103]
MQVSRLRPRGKWIAGLVATVLTTGALPCVSASAVSGGPAAEGAYRFVAKLDFGTANRSCSGALIDPQWVITASACFGADPETGRGLQTGPPSQPTTATFGRTGASGQDGPVLNVVTVVAHPERDLALVRLEEPVADIAPLAIGVSAPRQDEVLTTAGFGRTATEWLPYRVHTAQFSVTSVEATTVGIVGTTPQASICKGDAGGPAFRTNGSVSVELVALHSASWQAGCKGEIESRKGATETRVDDLGVWIQQQIVQNSSDLGPGTGPAATMFQNKLMFFGRNTSNVLQRWSIKNGEAHRQESWGGSVVGKPAAVVFKDHVTVFARGADGTLQHWWTGPDGVLGGHDTWGGGLGGDPTVLVSNGFLTVFARGADGTLQHWWLGKNETSFHRDHWGGGVAGDPAAVVFNDAITVFARGTDGTLQHWWLGKNETSAHRDHWGGGVTGNPTTAVFNDAITVFARGTDGTLQHWWLGKNETSAHRDHWGGGVAGNPSTAATGDELTVFARGTDGTLQHWWLGRNEISAHRDHWGGGVTGNPTATRFTDGNVNILTVFARGAGNSLQHWWFSPADGVHRDQWGTSFLS